MKFVCEKCNEIFENNGIIIDGEIYCNKCILYEVKSSQYDVICTMCHEEIGEYYGNKTYKRVCYNCKHFGDNGNYLTDNE